MDPRDGGVLQEVCRTVGQGVVQSLQILVDPCQDPSCQEHLEGAAEGETLLPSVVEPLARAGVERGHA
jgi:hypothetical protein